MFEVTDLIPFQIDMESIYAEKLLLFIKEVIESKGLDFYGYNSVNYFCESDVRCNITLVGDGDIPTSVIHTDLAEDLKNANFYAVLEYLDHIGVPVESFSFCYNGDRLTSDVQINSKKDKSKGYFVRNLETGKLELYFQKEYYMSLSEEDKKKIKSNYLFSKRNGGVWVSRAKFPNLYRSKQVAFDLGLVDEGVYGEKLSFEEQMEKKAERAEARAERYMQYSENAEKRGQQLQSGFSEAARDIAFVTQPNINSSSGRAFTRYRERLLEAYERGFEEFKKSEYYADKAETAMATAHGTKPTNKSFILRREEECEKAIRAQKKNITRYEKYFERIKRGEILHTMKGDVITIEKAQELIDNAYEIIDDNLSKLVYYDKCMSELGGVEFSNENIRKGYKVRHEEWGLCEVVGTGPKNFSYIILEGGAKGCGGRASYAEIEEIVSTDVSDLEKEMHPFKVGEVYTVPVWNGREYVDGDFEVVKVSQQRVSLRGEDGKTIVRKPTKRVQRDGEVLWYLNINDSYRGVVCKKAE